MLRDAGSPMKSFQLAKECQVPKKKLNQVLYRMKEESKVSLEGQAMWGLGKGRTEVEPAELAQPSQGNLPRVGGRGGQHEQSWQWTSGAWAWVRIQAPPLTGAWHPLAVPCRSAAQGCERVRRRGPSLTPARGGRSAKHQQ